MKPSGTRDLKHSFNGRDEHIKVKNKNCLLFLVGTSKAIAIIYNDSMYFKLNIKLNTHNNTRIN